MDLSEKELQLLEAYKEASIHEKRKVDKILNIDDGDKVSEIKNQKWNDNCMGSLLMQLLNLEKEEVIKLTYKMNFKQMHDITEILARDGLNASPQKVRNILNL